MARRSRNLPITVCDEDGNPLPEVAQSPIDYVPTDQMLRIRAEYFSLLEQNPLDMRDTRAKVEEYFPKHKAGQILRLMDTNPSFEAWFSATHEFTAKIKYLGDKALSSLEQVLNETHPAAAAAKVKAAQLILALAGRQPASPDTAKDNIAAAMKNLNSAELKALMASGTEVSVSVKKPKTLDVAGVKYDDE